MKPWLFVGAKVTPRNPCPYYAEILNDAADFIAPKFGEVYTVTAICPQGSLVALQLGGMPEDTGYNADDFRPVTGADATVADLKKAMLDHVASASGGAGITKVRA